MSQMAGRLFLNYMFPFSTAKADESHVFTHSFSHWCLRETAGPRAGESGAFCCSCVRFVSYIATYTLKTMTTSQNTCFQISIFVQITEVLAVITPSQFLKIYDIHVCAPSKGVIPICVISHSSPQLYPKLCDRYSSLSSLCSVDNSPIHMPMSRCAEAQMTGLFVLLMHLCAYIYAVRGLTLSGRESLNSIRVWGGEE